MGVQAAEQGSAYHLLVVLQGNVPIAEVPLAEPEVDDVDLFIGLLQHEVGRLQVPVQVPLLVDPLHDLEGLAHDLEGCVSGYEFGELFGCIFLTIMTPTSRVISSLSMTMYE